MVLRSPQKGKCVVETVERGARIGPQYLTLSNIICELMQDVGGSPMACGTFSWTLVALLAGAGAKRASAFPQGRATEQNSVQASDSDVVLRRIQGRHGVPFVLRIHNDAGYVCPPHTHPTDENIVVVKGDWSVGMGTRVNLSSVQPLENGRMPLYRPRWRTSVSRRPRPSFRSMVSAHSQWTWSIRLDELTPKGVNRMMSFGAPEQVVQDYPASCFTFTIGDRVSGSAGEGDGRRRAMVRRRAVLLSIGCRRAAGNVSGRQRRNSGGA